MFPHYAALSSNALYMPLRVHPDGFPRFLKAFTAFSPDFAGFSVTMPFKVRRHRCKGVPSLLHFRNWFMPAAQGATHKIRLLTRVHATPSSTAPAAVVRGWRRCLQSDRFLRLTMMPASKCPLT